MSRQSIHWWSLEHINKAGEVFDAQDFDDFESAKEAEQFWKEYNPEHTYRIVEYTGKIIV